MFSFSFKISKSWPATETTKLLYNKMYLPATLISAPWRTTKADKCYRLSFDLFTAAVDRDGRPRTSRSAHWRRKQSAINDYTLSHIVPLSIKKDNSHTKYSAALTKWYAAGVISFCSVLLSNKTKQFCRSFNTRCIQMIKSLSASTNDTFDIFTNLGWQ